MKLHFLQAVGSVHVGEGAAMGAIDLPVAREGHTGWPWIAGSSIKGALRSRATALGAPGIVEAFGPEPPVGQPEDEEELETVVPHRPDRVRFGPAVLLALPVRSLKGGFVLLTCPLALARLGRALGVRSPIPRVDPDQVLVAPNRLSAFAADPPERGQNIEVVVLEEIDLPGVESTEVGDWAALLGRTLAGDAPLDHLALVHDDLFRHAAQAWLPATTRAAVAEDGVVADGALFTVESAPPDTLWWCLVHDARPTDPLPARGECWVVGGLTTIGMGRVAWFLAEEAPDVR